MLPCTFSKRLRRSARTWSQRSNVCVIIIDDLVSQHIKCHLANNGYMFTEYTFGFKLMVHGLDGKTGVCVTPRVAVGRSHE